MSNLSRRVFLLSAAAAVTIASPAIASAPRPDMRPHVERVREKVAELRALMREVYPVERWHWTSIVEPTNTDGCRLLISVTSRGPTHKVEDTER